MGFPRCKCLGHEQGVTAKSKEREEDPGEPPLHKHLHPPEDDILEKPLDMNAVRKAEDAEDETEDNVKQDLIEVQEFAAIPALAAQKDKQITIKALSFFDHLLLMLIDDS